jgi:hypothetical protein
MNFFVLVSLASGFVQPLLAGPVPLPIPPAPGLTQLVYKALIHQSTLSAIQALFTTFEISFGGIEAVHGILFNGGHTLSQHYESIKEDKERTKLLLNQAFITDERYHETIYSPEKLLNNIAILREFFDRPLEQICYKGKFLGKFFGDERRLVRLYMSDKSLAVKVFCHIISTEMAGLGREPESLHLVFCKLDREHLFQIFSHLVSTQELVPKFSTAFRGAWRDSDEFQEILINDAIIDKDELFIRCMIGSYELGNGSLRPKSKEICKSLGEFNREYEPEDWFKLKEIVKNRKDRMSLLLFYLRGDPAWSGSFTDTLLEKVKGADLNIIPPYFIADDIAAVSELPDGRAILNGMSIPPGYFKSLPRNPCYPDFLNAEDLRERWIANGNLNLTDDSVPQDEFDPNKEYNSINGRVLPPKNDAAELADPRLSKSMRIADMVIARAEKYLLQEDVGTEIKAIVNSFPYLLYDRRKLDLSKVFLPDKGQALLKLRITPLEHDNIRFVWSNLCPLSKFFAISQFRQLADSSWRPEQLEKPEQLGPSDQANEASGI